MHARWPVPTLAGRTPHRPPQPTSSARFRQTPTSAHSSPTAVISAAHLVTRVPRSTRARRQLARQRRTPRRHVPGYVPSPTLELLCRQPRPPGRPPRDLTLMAAAHAGLAAVCARVAAPRSPARVWPPRLAALGTETFDHMLLNRLSTDGSHTSAFLCLVFVQRTLDGPHE